MNARLPTDQVVEIMRTRDGSVYGVARWRASITRANTIRWHWRAWDVLDPSLGGEGTIATGQTRLRREALELALGVLRRKAGAGG